MRHKPLMLLSSEGGCAAKIGPADLRTILEGLAIRDVNTQSIIDRREDAGYFELHEGLKIVQSVDIISAVSDDPGRYGAIAAVHAMNDIYAKGALPVTALCILGLPTLDVPLNIGTQIIQGAIDKLDEAGARLLGGHTIESQELLFGLSVTGIVKGALISNSGCQPGDLVVLTKALGSGISITGLKFLDAHLPVHSFDRMAIKEVEEVMLQLSWAESKAMMHIGVSACTDVSGFGFIGHLSEMLEASDCSARINMKDIPILPGVIGLAEEQILPNGCDRNFAYWEKDCLFSEAVLPAQRAVLFDPQTAGGLLISVAPAKVQGLKDEFEELGVKNWSVVGQVSAQKDRRVYIEP